VFNSYCCYICFYNMHY